MFELDIQKDWETIGDAERFAAWLVEAVAIAEEMGVDI